MASSPSKAPQSSPAGVPSGNGKYIVIAVLLLGSIAAVTIWQLTKKPPETVTIVDAGPAPSLTVANTGRDQTEDIPLPPPVVDAGEKKPTGTGQVVSSGQCDVKKCAGHTTSELETALSFRTRQAHRCYDTALGQDPTLRGKITVAVRVGSNGQTCPNGVSVASNEMSSPTVANCVLNYYRGQSFPAPAGGCADVNIPINFVPRQ
ncbi:MAG: AgmX/PglI C-terminal domain-containing protein [Labilithrix sp.]